MGTGNKLSLDRVYQASFALKDVARKTDLIYSPHFSNGNEVYLKTENLQVTGSFKLRGAYFKISRLSDEEKAAIDKVVEAMSRVELVGCTACKYCVEGCPMGISIPDVISAINTARKFPGDMRPQFFYNGLVDRYSHASDCIGCGQCEGVCPQHLPIISLMQEAVEKFEKK